MGFFDYFSDKPEKKQTIQERIAQSRGHDTSASRPYTEKQHKQERAKRIRANIARKKASEQTAPVVEEPAVEKPPTPPAPSISTSGDTGKSSKNKKKEAVKTALAADQKVKSYYETMINKIRDEWDKKEDRVRKYQLIAGLVSAVAKFGAAYQTLHDPDSAVDVSSIKFDPTPFEKQLDRLAAGRKGAIENFTKWDATRISRGGDSGVQKRHDERMAQKKIEREDRAKRLDKRLNMREKALKQNADQFEAKHKLQTDKYKRISPKEREKLLGFENNLVALDHLESLQSGLITGRIPAAITKMAEALGIESTDTAVLKQAIFTQVSQTIRLYSGLASSEAEMKRIAKTLPSFDLRTDVFLAKLNESRRRLRVVYQAELASLDKVGKDTSAWRTAYKTPQEKSKKFTEMTDKELKAALTAKKAGK